MCRTATFTKGKGKAGGADLHVRPAYIPGNMETNQLTIENLRTKYDSHLMSINGVVSVSTGMGKSGKPCLKIGTSLPTDQVRPKLPEELFQMEIELEYFGEINSQ